MLLLSLVGTCFLNYVIHLSNVPVVHVVLKALLALLDLTKSDMSDSVFNFQSSQPALQPDFAVLLQASCYSEDFS